MLGQQKLVERKSVFFRIRFRCNRVYGNELCKTKVMDMFSPTVEFINNNNNNNFISIIFAYIHISTAATV